MEYYIAAISFVAAFIFSLGGIGAAIILIPILHSFGIPLSVAKPVGLFYNTISLAGASINNIRNKRLDFKLGIPIIIFSFLFAIIGAYVTKYIASKIILLLFISFLVFSGFMFLLFKGKKETNFREDIPYISLSLIGAVAGLLSGMLGIGGGGIISPLLLMIGFNPKKITTITAFVVPFSSLSGFLTYWTIGTVDWKLLIITSLAGVAGATIGTIFMQKRLNPKIVKRILAIILLIMAVKMGLPLFPKAAEIIERYKDHPKCLKKDRLLTVPSNVKYNAYLKEVADIAKVNKHLTTHIARKTFATTVMLANGANIGVVSRLLGHSDVRVTLDAYGTFHDQLMMSDVGMIREKFVSENNEFVMTELISDSASKDIIRKSGSGDRTD